MNKNSPNFIPGMITKVESTQSYVSIDFLNNLVNSGKVTIELHTHTTGHIHVHLSGLNDKKVSITNLGMNGFDINIQ